MNSCIRPQHKVWEPIVEVPTIFVEVPKNRPTEVSLQWFGKADLEPLTRKFGDGVAKAFGQMQFRFHIPVDILWMGRPEFFQVIFVDKAKNWPNKSAVPAFGDPEKWLLWVASTHYSSGAGSACFAVDLNVMLGDVLYGIIEPRPYCDIKVLERAKQKLN